MTTNQTIDGVPRADLEAALKADASRGATVSELVAGWAAMERLRAFLDASYPSEAQLIAAGLGYPMSKEDAVKAYKASLVPRTDSPANADCEWCHGCGHDPYGEPCVGCCTPAAQPQGEPVAWIVTDMNGDSYFAYDKQTPNDKPLYAGQPAPVAVVLPDRDKITLSSPLKMPSGYTLQGNCDYELQIWRACIDEVKRLNP